MSMGAMVTLCVVMFPGLCTEPSTFSGLNTFLSNDYILQCPALMLAPPKVVGQLLLLLGSSHVWCVCVCV